MNDPKEPGITFPSWEFRSLTRVTSFWSMSHVLEGPPLRLSDVVGHSTRDGVWMEWIESYILLWLWNLGFYWFWQSALAEQGQQWSSDSRVTFCLMLLHSNSIIIIKSNKPLTTSASAEMTLPRVVKDLFIFAPSYNTQGNEPLNGEDRKTEPMDAMTH